MAERKKTSDDVCLCVCGMARPSSRVIYNNFEAHISGYHSSLAESDRGRIIEAVSVGFASIEKFTLLFQCWSTKRVVHLFFFDFKIAFERSLVAIIVFNCSFIVN